MKNNCSQLKKLHEFSTKTCPNFQPKFNLGDRVIHCSHGKGTLLTFTCDPTSALVQFDKEVKGWYTDILEVSIACLKKLEE